MENMTTPTTEQLRADAIKKAWIAEIGEETFKKISPDLNGWYFYQLNDEREIIKGLSPRNMSFEFNNAKQDNVNLIYFYRPKSLSGIEKNQNWKRIDIEGLPAEKGDYFGYYPDGSISCFWFNPDDDFDRDLFSTELTHYQEITKPKPPIF